MIVCENLVKIYKTQEIEVVALQGLDLTVEDGELMAIIGNSGSGKSTLLNMLGGLDTPSAGQLTVDGKNLLKMTPAQMRDYKRSTVGFVWQNHARNLIPYLTAQENVELPMTIGGKVDHARAKELLEMVGLGNRCNNLLSQLSGGEQQRVAIAIALSNNPRLLLADEPTGAVDSKTTVELLHLFRELNQKLKLTIVIVTHDRLVASFVDRAVTIRDGRTSSESLRKHSYQQQLANLQSFEELNHPIEETHEEVAVLDRAGRLTLPHEYLQALGIDGKDKLRVSLSDGKIVLSKYDADTEAAEASVIKQNVNI